MNTSKILSGVGIVLGIVLSVVALSQISGLKHIATQAFGGASGQTFSNQIFLQDSETVGGYDLATTSRGTVTYTADNIARSRVIEHIATAATTGTLPTNAALSSIGFLQNVGDTKTIFIQASTTKITIAGNTGLQLNSASTSLDINPGRIGRLEFVRLGATEGRLIQVFLSND